MEIGDQAVQFVGRFLGWYQDSYSLPDVVNRHKIEELVREAENIHVQRIQELERELVKSKATKPVKKQANRKVTRKRISRYL